MIGPPGLPQGGRPVSSILTASARRARASHHVLKWLGGLYLAGVLAHFSHNMALGLPDGMSFDQALATAPISLVWPADLIGTLIAMT